MILHITKQKLFEWFGRVVFYGVLVMFVLYHAYQLGYEDGKSNGYVRGYVEGKLGLKPVDPNLPQGEREERQFETPQPKQNRKGSSEDDAVTS